MSMTNFDKNVNIISSLSDEPNSSDGLTADELKAKFDAAANLIKDYINNTQNVGIDAALALKLNIADVNDFVVETGTNNGWFYRKWKSGKQEAWRQANYGAVAITTAWGSLYQSSDLACGLPTGMFTNVMYQQASLAGTGGGYVLGLMCGSLNTDTGYTQTMFATRATPGTTTALYVLHYLFGY